jgi:catechol 2,3-dioxygenase
MGECRWVGAASGNYRTVPSGDRLSDTAKLGDALRRLIDARIPLDGVADHGVSEALYLRDPDGNGVELYWDRPREDWPRNAEGGLAMYTRALDLQSLLEAAD